MSHEISFFRGLFVFAGAVLFSVMVLKIVEVLEKTSRIKRQIKQLEAEINEAKS